ncbi:universal stress protein [Rhodococcoides corynebacterioides]|uniref:universal stress protein n=1 Tax=Rhodococcoides corynebacterioides TaxID=53972 RepID=UPI00082A1ABF|nr:universal stress protein [Rhodococcus corynebacterioides]
MSTSAVVVGVDGSSSTRAAVRWAADAALSRHAPLLIVSAALLTPGTFTDGINLRVGVFGEQRSEAHRALDSAVAVARESTSGRSLDVHTAFEHGAAAEVLVGYSDHAQLVVVGSRRLGEISGVMYGSVGVHVAAHARCPVVIVKTSSPDGPSPDGPIVVGVDGSSASEAAIRWAFDESSRRSTDLVAVHAWTDVDAGAAAVRSGAYPSDDNLSRAEDSVLAESLAGFSEHYPDVHVRREVFRDNPVRELLRESADAQMVVTGTRGRGGFTALMLGSTSRALIHRAAVPVVVVPPHRSTSRP